jgi:adenylate kinase family enzyme
LDCSNKVIPTRTVKEYYEENKGEILEYNKDYYEANKEAIKENKKQYYEDNKEKISEYSKEYRQNNKEIIKENKNKKIDCECGSVFSNVNKLRHLKTLKHIKYCESLKSK